MLIAAAMVLLGTSCQNAVSPGSSLSPAAHTPSDTMKKNAAVFDLDLSSLPYNLPEHTKICIPESRYDCSYNNVCTPNKPTVFLLYDQHSSRIYRCDRNPCDSYAVDATQSGGYKNLSAKTNNGSLIKISADDEYIEIATFGLDTILYSGTCKNDS